MDAPDIAQYFPHLQERVMPHSMGQPVLSDWADLPDDHELKLYKTCGFLNRDEAAILYQCSKQLGPAGMTRWLDIGGHTGWTALHIAAGGAFVEVLDPMYANWEFQERARANLERAGKFLGVFLHPYTSRMYFGGDPRYSAPMMRLDVDMRFDGVMIDGDHSWGEPLYDAEQAFKHLNERGVIVLHDAIGAPVLAGVLWLVSHGMKAHIYYSSSQLLAVCWRGEFTPPAYTPDPRIDWVTYRNVTNDFLFQEWK